MSFSQECRAYSNKWWEASFKHPFVTGIGDGSLPTENFRYYVLQDSYYLAQFAKVQSFAAGLSDELHTTYRMAVHAQGTYEAELGLHQKFSEMLQITDKDRLTFKAAPTAYAYTSHLYRAVMTGQLGDIIAAILPCYWLYLEVGEFLKECQPEEPVYQQWIAAYNGEWFKELVDEQIQRLDELAEKATPEARERMKEQFLISSYYEYYFWEMAYSLEGWDEKAAVISSR